MVIEPLAEIKNKQESVVNKPVNKRMLSLASDEIKENRLPTPAQKKTTREEHANA